MIKTIYVCDTLYQIIVAYCVQREIQEQAAIVLTDHTYGMEKIYIRMKQYSSLFSEIYFVEGKKFSEPNNSFKKEDIDEEIIDFIEKNNLYSCEHLLIGCFEPYMRRLVKVFKTSTNNRNFRIGIIEDGFATYSFFSDVINKYEYKEDIQGIFIFEPNLLAWKPDTKVFSVNRNAFFDDYFVEELNIIFGFGELTDKYDEKCIVLLSAVEEMAPITNKDDILEIIDSHIGKENILIKTHPRIESDAYKKAGFKTNSDSHVPWEMIALNMDFSNKIIIGGYSGSLYTPRILFDKKMIGVSVMNLLSYTDPLEMGSYYKKYIPLMYKDTFYFPDDGSELISLLGEFK